jgi:hypothetical protein
VEVKYSKYNGKPIKEIRDEEGNLIFTLHGELNIDALARCLLGMKQKVGETKK